MKVAVQLKHKSGSFNGTKLPKTYQSKKSSACNSRTGKLCLNWLFKEPNSHICVHENIKSAPNTAVQQCRYRKSSSVAFTDTFGSLMNPNLTSRTSLGSRWLSHNGLQVACFPCCITFLWFWPGWLLITDLAQQGRFHRKLTEANVWRSIYFPKCHETLL